MKPKYPNITISLTGREGNAFYILGKVRTALIQAGASEEEREAFYKQATSGDYDHLLSTVMEWVGVE